MNTAIRPTALLAEDEPLLAQALREELRQAWPELHVLDCVSDGLAAVQKTLSLQPDVLFFDIRMPGMSGLEAATVLIDEWDTHTAGMPAFPVLVFVTAYDQYAVQAFEAQALDYILKPVQSARLARTVAKVQATLVRRAGTLDGASVLEQTLGQLRHLMGGPEQPKVAPLHVIQASSSSAAGTSIRLVPVADVVYFEAADKYLRVMTREAEYLIRTPLKELLPQLDNQAFWQIHRGTVVRSTEIDSVVRDEAGRLSVNLRGRPERLPVSRLYAHLFRAM